MAAKLTPAEIEMLHAQNLLDQGWQLREEYEGLLKRRKANRDSLRNAVASGLISAEMGDEVNDLYPPRARRQSPDELLDSVRDDNADTEAVGVAGE